MAIERDKYTSRNLAARILREVAEDCDVGMYPQSISSYNLGKAIGRALVNCNEQDIVKQFLEGWKDYDTEVHVFNLAE